MAENNAMGIETLAFWRCSMWVGILCMLGVVSLWSITSVLIKIALRTIDPFTLSFLRLSQGAVVMALAYKLRGGRWFDLLPKDRWVLIGGAGVSVNYIFFILGLNYTTAGAGGLVIQVQFVTLAVLAAVVLHERLAGLKLLGMLSVVLGVTLVFWGRGELGEVFRSQYALGNALMILGGIGWGVYALSNKVLSSRMGNLEILIPILAIGAISSGLAAIPQFEMRSSFSPGGISAIVILGVFCTGANFILLAEGIKRLSASLAGTMTSLTPLFNLLLAHWVLGEELSGYMFVSSALIISGILGIVFAEWNR
ncbi:MAG: DMT family transporter [bacterium]